MGARTCALRASAPRSTFWSLAEVRQWPRLRRTVPDGHRQRQRGVAPLPIGSESWHARAGVDQRERAQAIEILPAHEINLGKAVCNTPQGDLFAGRERG